MDEKRKRAIQFLRDMQTIYKDEDDYIEMDSAATDDMYNTIDWICDELEGKHNG